MSDITTYVPAKTLKPRNRAGRKTELQRTEIKIEQLNAQRTLEREQEALKRRAAIEAQRAPRQQPDTPFSLMLFKVGAGIALATSFTVSYFTLVAVAEWMQLPLPWLQYAVPGGIEVVIILSALDYIISESRRKGSGVTPWWVMIGVSGLAVFSNAAHTIDKWGADFGGQNLASWVGVALSAAMPLIVFYVSKRLSATVFAEPEA